MGDHLAPGTGFEPVCISAHPPTWKALSHSWLFGVGPALRPLLRVVGSQNPPMPGLRSSGLPTPLLPLLGVARRMRHIERDPLIEKRKPGSPLAKVPTRRASCL